MKPKLEYDYDEKIYTESEIRDMFGADVLEKLHCENCDLNGEDWEAEILVNALVRGNWENAVYEETEISLYAIYADPEGWKEHEGDLGDLDWEIDHYRLI